MSLIIEMLFNLFMGYGALGSTVSQIDKVLYITLIMIILKIGYPVVKKLINKLKGAFNLW